MASYVNSRKLFVILVCLQSIAVFTRAFQVRVTSGEPENLLTVEFQLENGGPVKEMVYFSDVFKSFVRTSQKVLPYYNGGTICFAVGYGGSSNMVGYLMAYEKCAETDCKGYVIQNGQNEVDLTCNFGLGSCNESSNVNLICSGGYRPPS